MLLKPNTLTEFPVEILHKTLGIGWINLLWVGFHFETEFNPPRNGGKTENHIFTVKILDIYIYIPGTCLSPLFLGFNPPKEGPNSNQNKGHQRVPGLYISYINKIPIPSGSRIFVRPSYASDLHISSHLHISSPGLMGRLQPWTLINHDWGRWLVAGGIHINWDSIPFKRGF